MKEATIVKAKKVAELIEQGFSIERAAKKMKISKSIVYSYLRKLQEPEPIHTAKEAFDIVEATELPKSTNQPSLAHRIIHSNLDPKDKVTVLEMAYGI